MTLDGLQSQKISAFKAGDKTRVKVLNDIIILVQKEQTKGKTKIEATEELVMQCAIKAQKTLEEMVATCPGKTEKKDYTPLLEDYKAQLAIVKEYAPQLITDENEIRGMILDILNNEYGLTKKNKGVIMKIVMPVLKGKVDMSIANRVLGEMLV